MKNNEDNKIVLTPHAQVLYDYIKNKYKTVTRFAKETGYPAPNNIYRIFKGTRKLEKLQMVNIVEHIGYDIFNDKPLDTNLSYVPEYSVQLSAGGGQDATLSNKIKDIPLPNDIIYEYHLNVKTLCVLTVKGDSMVPTFMDQEKVLIDTSCDLDYKKHIDKVMAVRFNGLAYIKRISLDHDGKLELTSDNKVNNGNMKISKGDDFQIIGKPVLSVYRKFNQ